LSISNRKHVEQGNVSERRKETKHEHCNRYPENQRSRSHRSRRKHNSRSRKSQRNCYSHAMLFGRLNKLRGCRLCLVEIIGSPKLFPACATPVSTGMEVVTNSDRLKDYRKMAVQMLLAERTHICSVCIADDHCELQQLANQLGVDHVTLERNWTALEIDSTHDFLVIDRNRCILCTRCIRVCDEIEGVHTLDLKLRAKTPN